MSAINKNQLNLLNSNSKQLVKQTAEIEQVTTNPSDSFQVDYLTPLHQQAEIVQWSPAMQSMLDEPSPRLPRYLVLGSIVFCGFFLMWAWIGKVDQIGTGQGRLIPKGETYKIDSIESAKIDDIAVEEGQKVKANQIIVRLDSEQQMREVERLKQLIPAYQIELNQKKFLLEQEKVETKTHQHIAKAEVQAQTSAIKSAISELKITNNLLEKKQAELNAHLTRDKQVQNLSSLEQEKLAQINAELLKHQKRLKRLEPLVSQGAISEEVLFQAQQSYHQIQQQQTDNKLQGISNISERIFESEQALRSMEASIVQNQGDLVAVQKKIEQLQAELAHKIAQRQTIELEAQQKEEQIKLEIGQTKTKIAETKNQLATALSLVKQKTLKSPVPGTVLSLNVSNTGKVVQPGDTIAEIAPQGSELVLSAIVPERKAGFIEPGMSAQVKLDAYSYQDYGVIPGKIISISGDTKTDEKLGVGYQVKIELERNYITDDQLQKTFFKPGQTANADILIRQRRIIDVLLDPIKKIEQNGIDL